MRDDQAASHTDDGDQPMTTAQAPTLKGVSARRLRARANLTRAEAKKRIIIVAAKLKLLGGPPRTL